jgi:hypothetical protein
MINRKKKIKIIQFSLLFLGILIFFYTYLFNNSSKDQKNLLSISNKKIEQNQSINTSEDTNVFYNIEYAGFDLSGNRYVINSKEAKTNKANEDEIYMKGVQATFYFKDDNTLKILSSTGVYNNRTLNMRFEKNIQAFYEKSTLTANFAEYLNQEGLVTISDKVEITDFRGNLTANKLLFDLKTQTLNISSQDKKDINLNIKTK